MEGIKSSQKGGEESEYIVIVTFLFVAIALSVVIILLSYILAVQKL